MWGLALGVLASLIAAALVPLGLELWTTEPAKAVQSILRAHWFLLVLAILCFLFLFVYWRLVYNRKDARTPYRVFDLALVCFLVTAGFCAWSWADLRHARTLRELRLVEDELFEADPGLEAQILSFLKRRRDLPDAYVDTDYTYEQMVVNLFLVDRIGCIERTMRGEPEHPGSFKPIKVSFMSDVPPQRLFRNMTFEWLDGPEGRVIEVRQPLHNERPDTKNWIRGVVFTYAGFDDEFWSRRRMCWPGSMKANDFFMFYLDQFMRVEGTRVSVNFFADRPVNVSLETVAVDAKNSRSLRRRPVRRQQEPPAPAAWGRVPQTRGRVLRTAVSWRPRALREKLALVVHFAPREPQPFAGAAARP